jgi:hypothetical protein
LQFIGQEAGNYRKICRKNGRSAGASCSRSITKLRRKIARIADHRAASAAIMRHIWQKPVQPTGSDGPMINA